MKRLAIGLLLTLVAVPVSAAEPFTLKDGDRVVFLGNTLIEREQRYGWWEFALTTLYADRNITFRNLGWSGDTVWGEARAVFGTQADGFKQLKEHVLALKPSVIIIGYGGNEAFAGTNGIEKFEKGLNDLLDALAPTKARIVLLSPLPYDYVNGPPLSVHPDKQIYNTHLYARAIARTATKRDCTFVDLVSDLVMIFSGGPKVEAAKLPALTENGLHLTDEGYRWSAATMAHALASGRGGAMIEISDDGKISKALGAKVDQVEANGRRFRVVCNALPWFSPTRGGNNTLGLRFEGLAPGKYSLYIDGKRVATGTELEWKSGHGADVGPEFDQSENFRQLIIEKNRLYFHRWRPQNETYLFGFRKKEQGQNAVEIPQFDPLIAELEGQIAKLRVPQPHVYELKPE